MGPIGVDSPRKVGEPCNDSCQANQRTPVDGLEHLFNTHKGSGRVPYSARPPSSKRKTLYDVLGVSIKAPREEIKRAYRALALQLHPDKCASPTANERFKAVQEAYATLGDRSRRAAYDASL